MADAASGYAEIVEKRKINTNTIMSRSDWTNYQNQIRRFRQQRNLRLRDVARLVGIRDAPHVSEWESGDRVPTLESALKLSAALECPIEVLFCDHFKVIREEVMQRRHRFNIKREFN